MKQQATPTQQQAAVIEGPKAGFFVPEYVKDVGRYNFMPTPWVEVECPDEILGRLGMYGIRHTEFRQVMSYLGPNTYTDAYKENPESKHCIDLTILWGFDMAVAFSRSRQKSRITPTGYEYEWEKTRWFRIGCVHEYKQTADDGWVMYFECKKCGFKKGNAYK